MTGTETNNNTENKIVKHTTRKLIDIIILQQLNNKQMHGYEVIKSIKQNYNIHFEPYTIYPILTSIQKQKHIESHWSTNNMRPIKIYNITPQGTQHLTIAKETLLKIYNQLTTPQTESE